jgi:hypothetical protein
MKIALPLVCLSSAPRSARRLLHAARFALLCAAPLLLSSAFGAEDEGEITAVSSRVSDDYVRSKQPNGTFLPETYAFGPGGYWSGGATDKTIDNAKFLDVAKVIATPLAQRNYLPTSDAKTTKLLIMVYWGTTNPPERTGSSVEFQNAARAFSSLQQSIASKVNAGGAPTASSSIKRATGQVHGDAQDESAADAAMAALQAQNELRRKIDVQNAQMLGYDSWWAATSHLEGTPLDVRRNVMLDELEDGRYFVVLMAYDFQLMWKQKKPKLLWETRFSISAHHHEFDKVLPAMAAYAAKYFGDDSHGLIRKPLRDANVELGELKSLGEVAPKK